MPKPLNGSPATPSFPVRVVLFGLPRLLADILRDTIDHHPDLKLVGEVQADNADWNDPDSISADVVLHGAGDSADGATARRILFEAPWMRVLQVTARGADTFVYEMQPQRTFLGELSPDELVDTIRSMPPGGADWVELEA